MELKQENLHKELVQFFIRRGLMWALIIILMQFLCDALGEREFLKFKGIYFEYQIIQPTLCENY